MHDSPLLQRGEFYQTVLSGANGYDQNSHPSVPFALFGNLQSAGCWLGQRGGMELRISYDATADSVNAFTNDLQLLRMTERIAFGVGQPSYLAILSTSVS